MKVEIKPAISKVSSVHIGRALTNFVNSIDTSETKIGDDAGNLSIFDDTEQEMVYSGHYLYSNEPTPNWIATKREKTKLVIQPMFRDALNKPAVECINDYFEWCEKSISEGFEVPDSIDGNEDRLSRDSIIDIVNKLNNYKMVIIPFKYVNIKASVKVEAEGISTKKTMLINGLKWLTDSESGELVCNILVEHRVTGSLGKSKLICIDEYGKSFNIDAVELANSSSKVKIANAIEYNKLGFVKPIEITNGTTSLIIDGTFIYYKTNSGTFIVGEWVRGGIRMRYTSKEDKLFKKLESYVQVASLHKRMIAPYLLVDTKVINVRVR